MKFFRVFVLIIIFLESLAGLSAQQYTDIKKLFVGGYLSNMQAIIDRESQNDYWLIQNQFHNRINVEYHPVPVFSMSTGIRNRFIFGDLVRLDFDGQYARSLDQESGWLDLSFNLFSGESYIINTHIDRLFFQLELNKLWITVGRQRINWGQNYVWNPNDWFNAYSFYDFDYEERPGSDAIRMQYFTGFTSSAEVAVKLDHDENITAAFLWRMNKWRYDFQLLGGLLASDDCGIGAGWSGHIWDFGFRGEMNYFHPLTHFSDTAGLFFISIGFDYIFNNSLMLQFEGLYNQRPAGMEQEDFEEYYQRSLSAKDLSFTEWNIFGQVSYPITPLLTGTLSAMFFPQIDGFFIGPNLTYSLSDNLDFSLIVQIFRGDDPNGITDDARYDVNFGFIRFKYNF